MKNLNEILKRLETIIYEGIEATWDEKDRRFLYDRNRRKYDLKPALKTLMYLGANSYETVTVKDGDSEYTVNKSEYLCDPGINQLSNAMRIWATNAAAKDRAQPLFVYESEEFKDYVPLDYFEVNKIMRKIKVSSKYVVKQLAVSDFKGFNLDGRTFVEFDGGTIDQIVTNILGYEWVLGSEFYTVQVTRREDDREWLLAQQSSEAKARAKQQTSM